MQVFHVVLPLFLPPGYHPVSSLHHSHITCKASWFYFFLMQIWLSFFSCFLTVLSSSFLPSLKHTSSGWLYLLLFPTRGILSILVVWDHSANGMAPSSHLYSRDKSLWLNKMSDDACWAPPHHHEFSGPERMLHFTPRAQASSDLWLFQRCLSSLTHQGTKLWSFMTFWAMTIQLKNPQGLSNHNVLHIFINCFLTCKAFCSNPLETSMPICYLVTRSLLKDTQSPLWVPGIT